MTNLLNRLPHIKARLLNDRAKSLSDNEIERIMSKTVMPKQNFYNAKKLRDLGYLTYPIQL